MALTIMSWDLPPADQIETYLEKSRTVWIPALLNQQGVKEFRAYRNPYNLSPQVMIHVEFDAMTSWLKYIQSDTYSSTMEDLRALGCTNQTLEVWDSSPIVPEPMRPSKG